MISGSGSVQRQFMQVHVAAQHSGSVQLHFMQALTGTVGIATAILGKTRLKFVAFGQCRQKLARFRTSIYDCDLNRSGELLHLRRLFCELA